MAKNVQAKARFAYIILLANILVYGVGLSRLITEGPEGPTNYFLSLAEVNEAVEQGEYFRCSNVPHLFSPVADSIQRPCFFDLIFNLHWNADNKSNQARVSAAQEYNCNDIPVHVIHLCRRPHRLDLICCDLRQSQSLMLAKATLLPGWIAEQSRIPFPHASDATFCSQDCDGQFLARQLHTSGHQQLCLAHDCTRGWGRAWKLCLSDHLLACWCGWDCAVLPADWHADRWSLQWHLWTHWWATQTVRTGRYFDTRHQRLVMHRDMRSSKILEAFTWTKLALLYLMPIALALTREQA